MKPLTSFFTVGTLVLPVAFITLNLSLPLHSIPTFSTVSARENEDREDEEGHNEDENKDEDNESDEEEYSAPVTKKSSQPKTIKVMKEVIEYKPVTTQVIVTEEAYAKDTDGDGLVDAIDPDPLVSQKEYFTDDDNDGVPNALDEYPGDDDFSYYQFESDDNNNGILDSYENI